MHDLLHAWLAQDEGVVKEKLAGRPAGRRRKKSASSATWAGPQSAPAADFPTFVDALHAHLHELAETAQPLGLHTLGRAPEEQHRLATVLLMLGRPFWEAAALHLGTPEDADEALVGDYEQAPRKRRPTSLLQRHVVQGESRRACPRAAREL
jgi:cobaltochelatase CobN